MLLKNLNFHPLEVVSRCRDPQLQVGEKKLFLLILTFPNQSSDVHDMILFVNLAWPSRGRVIVHECATDW